MAKFPLESEVEMILGGGKLSIEEDITWRKENLYFKTKVPIFNPYNLNLAFLAQKNVRLPKFSMVILYDNLCRIRCFDLSTHLNPIGAVFHPKVEPGRRYAGKHKHIWTDKYQDRCVYEPDDIQDKFFDQAILEFLNECKVNFSGRIEPLPAHQLLLMEGEDDD